MIGLHSFFLRQDGRCAPRLAVRADRHRAPADHEIAGMVEGHQVDADDLLFTGQRERERHVAGKLDALGIRLAVTAVAEHRAGVLVARAGRDAGGVGERCRVVGLDEECPRER